MTGLALLAVVGCVATREPQPLVYVVQKGDTLFLIGRAHGVTVDQLRAWNGIEGDLIEVGQALRIYQEDPLAHPPPSAPPPRAVPSDTRILPSDAAHRVLPREKPCLAGPTLEQDAGVAASVGLSEAQVRDTMGGFVEHTLGCFAGVQRAGTMELAITVACTGRVSDVRVLDAGPWTADVERCVSDTLRYAPFPAHDLPDGETFRYPLRFSPG